MLVLGERPVDTLATTAATVTCSTVVMPLQPGGCGMRRVRRCGSQRGRLQRRAGLPVGLLPGGVTSQSSRLTVSPARNQADPGECLAPRVTVDSVAAYGVRPAPAWVHDPAKHGTLSWRRRPRA